MPRLRPGIITIVLGVAFLAVGSAISFALPDLYLPFLTSVLAFSGLILTILGVRRVLRGSRRDWTIDIF